MKSKSKEIAKILGGGIKINAIGLYTEERLSHKSEDMLNSYAVRMSVYTSYPQLRYACKGGGYLY
jgi:hypothetical protein